MAIIYSYPLVTSIQPSDLLILSVDNSELPTRQVTVGDLLASGTVDVNLNFTADTGTGSVNLSTQSLEVRKGVYITTTATNQELIINHKSTVRQDTNIGDTSPGYGGSFTVIDSVVTDATGSGHVTGVNLKTVTLPAADDTNTTYDLLGYNTGIELVGSDGTRDQIQIVGSGDTTVSQANNTITVSSTSGVGGSGTANYLPRWTDADTLGDSGFYQVSAPVTADKAIGLNTTKLDSFYGEYPDLRVASRSLNDPGVLDLFRPDGDVQAGDRVGILQYSIDDDTQYAVAQIQVETLTTSGMGDSGGGKFLFKTTRGSQAGAIPEVRLELDNGSADFSVPVNVTNTSQSSFAGQVTIPLNPVSATDAASKGYVDSQSGGGGIGGSGTLNTIAMFTPDGTTIGNSTITLDSPGAVNENVTSSSKVFQIGTGAAGDFAQLNLLSSGSSGIINTSGSGNLILRTNNSSTAQLVLDDTGSLQAKSYGSGTFTGTAAYALSVDSSGNIIETTGGGGVGGSGTVNTIPIWSTATGLADSQITQDNTGADPIFDFNSITGTNQYTPPTNTVLYKLKSGDANKFSITQDGGGGVVLPSGDILNNGPSFNMGGNAFANGENALSVGAATTAFGNGSFAANFLTLASGGGASAFGLLTEATALASAAFGNKSQSTGNYSIAAGQDSIASGQSSVAIGEKGVAQGKNTFVQGFAGTASGNNAAKFGYDGSAGGNNAVKFGYESIASGNNSFASGWQTVASGLYSFTAGDGNIASGERTTAFGVDNNVSGKGSFAIGARNIVPSENSFVGGTDNTLVGTSTGVDGAQTSFVFGNLNTVEGLHSTVLGTNNDTGESTSANPSNRVTLIGHSNLIATGDSSTLIGVNNQNNGGGAGYIVGKDNVNTLSSNSYIFGRVNDIDSCNSSVIIGTANEMAGSFGTPNVALVGTGLKFDASGPNTGYGRATYVGYYNDDQDQFSQFQIGNGTPETRKNALSINKDSEIKISEYGSGTVTGTATYNLSVAADGKIIETADTTPTYSSFVCLLSQSGGANPQPNIVLENSLNIGGPFTAFTRVSSGEYNLNAPGKFKLLKTIVFLNGGSAENNHDIAWEVIDADNLRIRTHNSDGKLTKASLEIRTYN